MSGIDERPVFEMTEEKFKVICPACLNVETIYFKFNSTISQPVYYWNGRIGELSWDRHSSKPYAYLTDHRATYDSVEKHLVVCACGYNFSEVPKTRTRLINTFRGNIRTYSWRRREAERMINVGNR